LLKFEKWYEFSSHVQAKMHKKETCLYWNLFTLWNCHKQYITDDKFGKLGKQVQWKVQWKMEIDCGENGVLWRIAN